MLKMNDDLEGALKAYMKLLEEQEYFAAHEVLEEAWHPLRLGKHPLANLAKGLINGAITFEHIKRNRQEVKKRAQVVIASFERHKYLCVEGIEHYDLFKEACMKIEALKLEHSEMFVS